MTHIAALPGNPYDGHTLATVIPAMEDMIGNTIERLLADAGYRGHNAPIDYKFRVYTSGQKRRLTPQIKRELRRRAAIEPVIGHLKAEHRMGRNYLAHHAGDAVNAVLAGIKKPGVARRQAAMSAFDDIRRRQPKFQLRTLPAPFGESLNAQKTPLGGSSA